MICLGYIGLPVAASFAEGGFRVISVDLKSNRVAPIGSGENPIGGAESCLSALLAEVKYMGCLTATLEIEPLAQADVILIDLETPVARIMYPATRH